MRRNEAIEIRQIRGARFADGIGFPDFAAAFRYAKLLAGWSRDYEESRPQTLSDVGMCEADFL